MPRSVAVLMVMVCSVLCLAGTEVGAADTFEAYVDTLMQQYPGDLEIYRRDFESVGLLQEWFNEELAAAHRETYSRGGTHEYTTDDYRTNSVTASFRTVPVGAFTWHRPEMLRGSKSSLTAEYHHPLKTYNGVFTLHTWDTNSLEISARVFAGGGGADVENLGTHISTNYGGGVEAVYKGSDLAFNPLAGIFYLGAIADGPLEDGAGNYLYVGNRIYFSKARKLSIDLKGGRAFWSGFNDSTPPEWFLAAGLTLHQNVDLTKVGAPFLGPMEVGFFHNLPLNTWNTRFGVPMRFTRGLSGAFFGTIGTEIDDGDPDEAIEGSSPAVYEDVFSSVSAGAELRLWCDTLDKGLNPYLGFEHSWVKYHSDVGQSTGFSIFAGVRQTLYKLLAFDLRAGPMFWDNPEITVADSTVEVGPGDWMVQIGFSIPLSKVQEVPELRGAVITQRVPWGQAGPPNESDFSHLTYENAGIHDGEVRVFAIETKSDTLFCPQCPPCKPVEDISDLKFYTIDLDFGFEFDPFNNKEELLTSGRAREKETMIMVVFNKNRTLVKELDSQNTFFHFVDFVKGQYFGYRWDANRNRQPEPVWRGSRLGRVDSNRQAYLGTHEEFVKSLLWLDNEVVFDFISGNAIEDRILAEMQELAEANNRLYANEATYGDLESYMNDYRIAFVVYPDSTLNKIRDYRSDGNFGVTVMVGRDVNNDRRLFRYANEVNWWDGPNARPTDVGNTDIVAFDPEDDFFFSNHVKLQTLMPVGLEIGGFAPCDTVLTESQKATLRDKVVNRLKANDDEFIEVWGYADATRMTTECEERMGDDKTQLALAQKRADAVKAFLVAEGISASRVRVEAGGIRNITRPNSASDRCVVITFLQ